MDIIVVAVVLYIIFAGIMLSPFVRKHNPPMMIALALVLCGGTFLWVCSYSLGGVGEMSLPMMALLGGAFLAVAYLWTRTRENDHMDGPW